VRGNVRKQNYCTAHHVPKYFYLDEERRCVQCGAKFTFEAGEQKHWYETLGFKFGSIPVRCPPCRRRRRSEHALREQIAEAKAYLRAEGANSGAHLSLARALVEYHERTGHGDLDEAVAAARKAAGAFPESSEPLFWERAAGPLSGPASGTSAELSRTGIDETVISHPEKVLFPDGGITKGELCSYYEAMAPLMLPHVRGRPVTMERYPAGIDKKGFIQKDVSKGFPSWLERVGVDRRDEKEGGTVHYPLANDARSLIWMANQNSITPHVWCSRVPTLWKPDVCIFDLDPAGDEPKALRAAALLVRDLLDELGIRSFVKTSGSKGFHILTSVDSDGGADGEGAFDSTWRFAHGAGAVLVKRHPAVFTQEFIKADRGGRIFVDTGRNGPGATLAAVYAVRPKPGAPVSAPCTWNEIERGTVGPRTFTLRTMAGRIGEVGDLWREMDGQRRSLRDPMTALERLLTAEDWDEAWAASTRRPGSRKEKTTGKRQSRRRP
jgi:bifunctional non-homologous end joining protein LigD